jgi:hypothetical protein
MHVLKYAFIRYRNHKITSSIKSVENRFNHVPDLKNGYFLLNN